MINVVLTEEQAKQIAGRRDVVALRTPGGDVLAYVTPDPDPDPDEVAEILRRRQQPQQWHTTAEVLAHLKSKDVP